MRPRYRSPEVAMTEACRVAVAAGLDMLDEELGRLSVEVRNAQDALAEGHDPPQRLDGVVRSVRLTLDLLNDALVEGRSAGGVVLPFGRRG